MAFPNRAVEALRRCFERGEVVQSRVFDVLRCKGVVDVSCLERYLGVGYPEWVRCHAAAVIAQKGDPDVVVEAALREEDDKVLVFMLGSLGKRGEGRLERLAFILNQDGTAAKAAAITMFREAGREDCLLPLLFSRSDPEVAMAKRCMDERRH
jgi:hypothetical protein